MPANPSDEDMMAASSILYKNADALAYLSNSAAKKLAKSYRVVAQYLRDEVHTRNLYDRN